MFWNKLNSKKLFSKEILDYQVKTKKFGLVNYVNLDNAATTPPLLEVENGVKKYLIGYGSVHRGAGTKSKISTDIYERSREVIKKFVNSKTDDYVLFSGNTTGGINTAAYFFSFLYGKIMVSAVEHSSSWLPWIKTEVVEWPDERKRKEAMDSEDPFVLNLLSMDENFNVRILSACNPKTPTNSLRRLVEGANDYVKMVIANNPSATSDILDRIFELSGAQEVLDAVKVNPNVSAVTKYKIINRM